MNRRAREEERQRGVHMVILAVLTVAVPGVCLAAFLLQWSESWMSPLLLVGLLVCWWLHMGGHLTPGQRLWIYAGLAWAAILLDGVHPSSIYDISILATLELLLFSRTNNRRLLHVSFSIYVFCCFWQIRLLLTGQGVFPDADVPRLLSHAGILFIIYLMSLSMIKKRNADLAADEAEITALRAGQRRTEDFLAGISHELRAPVNTVMEIAADCMKDAADARDRENAENVLAAGKRLNTQVDDMLDYMNIETGELTVKEVSYGIDSLLRDVAADLGLYEKTDLPELLLDVDANTPVRMNGASALIGKILKQLIGNAIRFTREGGIHVHVYPDRPGGDAFNLCIDVRDTGTGMRRQELEHIRRSVFEADRDRHLRAGGLGLGFPIVNGLTTALHGFTNISSVPGEGTKVHVSIPQTVPDDTPCLRLPHPEQLKITFYQDPAKFTVPAVRDFYTEMIYHLIRDFKLTLHRVATQEDLKKLLEEDEVTHLFLGEEEYGRDPAFFDRLALSIPVTVVAKNGFRPSPSSAVLLLTKPLYTFPLVELLGGQT